MKKNKKIVTIILALALTFSLAACGGGNSQEIDYSKLGAELDDVKEHQSVIGMGFNETIDDYHFSFVDKSLLTEYYAIGGSILSVNPFLAFKPVEGKEEVVKQGVEEWVKNQTETFEWYQPHNIPLIEDRLVVEQDGYIFYFLTSANDQLEELMKDNITDGVFNFEAFSTAVMDLTVEGEDSVFSTLEQVTDETYPKFIETFLPSDLVDEHFILFSEWTNTSVFVINGSDHEEITAGVTKYYTEEGVDMADITSATFGDNLIFINSSNNQGVLEAIKACLI